MFGTRKEVRVRRNLALGMHIGERERSEVVENCVELVINIGGVVVFFGVVRWEIYAIERVFVAPVFWTSGKDVMRWKYR